MSERCDTTFLMVAKRRRPRKRHLQLALDAARTPCGHGGWRPRAGRPRTRRGVSHDRRECIARTHPQHITLRTVDGIPSLRSKLLFAIIRDAIAAAQRPACRFVHFSVLDNHIHLIIEAASNEARARAIQGLKSSIARRVNRLLERSGKLFADRYHARALTSPRQVRNALRYVLNNVRHHEIDRGMLLDSNWVDPCSSAPWFDGWLRPPRRADTPPSPRATVPPTVWLLTTGWRRHGLLRVDDVPGDRDVRDEVLSRPSRSLR